MQSAGYLLKIFTLTMLMITGVQAAEMTVSLSTPDQPKTWTAQDIQNTIAVTSVDDAGPGTLRNAIVRANASAGTDKIVFESSEGLYQQPQSIKLSSSLADITDSLIIDGYIDNMLWKASGVTLDGQGRFQIIRIAKGVNAKIANLTLTAGHAERGGAIENNGNTVLSGVLLTDNGATEFGGAVFNSGSLHLINSTVHHNRAGQAGGGLFHERGYLKVTHATFDGNESPKGGALYSPVEGVLQNSILANSVSEQDCFAETAFAKESTTNIIESSHLCGEVFSSADPGLGKTRWLQRIDPHHSCQFAQCRLQLGRQHGIG